nr:nucleocapsid protein [Brassica oleracea torzella virus 1]
MGDVSTFLSLFKDFGAFCNAYDKLSEADKSHVLYEIRTRLMGAGGDPTKVEPFGIDMINFLGLTTPLTPSGDMPPTSESFNPIAVTSQLPPDSSEQGQQQAAGHVPLGSPSQFPPLPTRLPAPVARVPTPPPLPPVRTSVSASQQSSSVAGLGTPSTASQTSSSALSVFVPAIVPPVQPASSAPQLPVFPSPPPGFPTSLSSLSTSSTTTSHSSSGQTSSFTGLAMSNLGNVQSFSDTRTNPLFGQSSSSSSTSPALTLAQSLEQVRLSSAPAPAGFSEDRLGELWNEIDNYDLSGIDADAFKIFEYQGFNPSMVLHSIKSAADEKKIDKDTMMMDIIYMCAVAAIKGSINDHNIARMSQAAISRIKMLEERYKVKRGGGRGEPPHVVTFSRVAASFPGKIMQLIGQKKIPAREFIGPLKSNTLPAVMRHQAFAAVIPSSLKERVREFLLVLSTAFSVDQSYCIRADKKEKFVIEEIFERQRNFIQITANAKYPKEAVRIQMFKQLQLEHDNMIDCARAVQSKFPDFRILSREEFVQAMTELP